MIDPSLQENFLKLRCSIPQSDSFFKRTFFKKPLILKKCEKRNRMVTAHTDKKGRRIKNPPPKLLAPLA